MSFPKYEVYKDSGVEWLGEVPEHWLETRLKHIALVNMGQSPNSDECNTEGQGLPFLQGNAEFGARSPIAKQFCQTVKKIAFQGDLLFSVRAPVGALNEADQSYGIGRGLCAITPQTEIVRNFLWWFLLSTRSFLDSISTGSTFEAVSAEQINNIFLALPSKEEQSQVACFLDHETARIDALIAEQQRLIELLKEKRQAVISHAVTKGLDPTAPMKDSGIEWLGEVPVHWTTKSYRYSSEIYRGKFGHRPRNDPSLYDGGFAFIQTGDIARAEKYITAYKQTLNEKGANVSQKFPAGTLVMAIAANVGDTAILGFEAYAPDSVVGFKPNEDIEIEFLRFSLMAAIQELYKTSTQSTQANLNIDRIGSVQAVFPPLAEQQKITKYLNHEFERYSELEHQAIKTIELMQERRSALISAAVTGKIDVRGWQAPTSVTPAPTLEPVHS
jgi:type I restriction enzyme S subunit